MRVTNYTHYIIVNAMDEIIRAQWQRMWKFEQVDVDLIEGYGGH